jgi:hypothetical protein
MREHVWKTSCRALSQIVIGLVCRWAKVVRWASRVRTAFKENFPDTARPIPVQPKIKKDFPSISLVLIRHPPADVFARSTPTRPRRGKIVIFPLETDSPRIINTPGVSRPDPNPNRQKFRCPPARPEIHVHSLACHLRPFRAQIAASIGSLFSPRLGRWR